MKTTSIALTVLLSIQSVFAAAFEKEAVQITANAAIMPGSENDDFIVIREEEETGKSESDHDDWMNVPESTEPASPHRSLIDDWEVLGDFQIPQNQIQSFSLLRLLGFFFGGNGGEGASSGSMQHLTSNLTPVQVQQLCGFLNFKFGDLKAFEGVVNFDGLYAELVDKENVIDRLEAVLNQAPSMFAQFGDKNLPLIKESIINNELFEKVVLLGVRAKNRDLIMKVGFESELPYQLRVENFIMALLSLEMDAFLDEVMVESGLIEHRVFDWSTFKMSFEISRLIAALSFALECPLALKRSSLVSQLLSLGARPDLNSHTSVVVAAKNAFVGSFNLLMSSLPEGSVPEDVLNSAMEAAISARSLDIVEQLVMQYKAPITVKHYLTAWKNGDNSVTEFIMEQRFSVTMNGMKLLMDQKDVSDEQILSILKRRLNEPVTDFGAKLIGDAMMKRRYDLVRALLEEESIALTPKNKAQVLNKAIRAQNLGVFRTILESKKVSVDHTELDVLTLMSQTHEYIDAVVAFSIRLALTDAQVDELIKINAWYALEVYLGYRYSTVLKNYTRLIKAAIKNNQIGIIKRLKAQNIPMPKDAASLTKDPEMKAAIEGTRR